MKRSGVRYLSALALSLCSIQLRAQVTGPVDTVRWGSAQGSDRVLRGGKVVKSLAAGDLDISVWLSRTDADIRAGVLVANLGPVSTDVEPESAVVVILAPKPRTLTYRDPDAYAKSIKRKAEWAAVLTELAGDLSTKEVTSETSVQTDSRSTVRARLNDGTRIDARGDSRATAQSNTTTTMPDDLARQHAREDARQLLKTADVNASGIASAAMRAETIGRDQFVSGLVYFNHDRRADSVIFRIRIGSTVYEFPFVLAATGAR